LSISRLARFLSKTKPAKKPSKLEKIFAVVATVTDDIRLLTVPKLHVCALRFTASARKRIESAGGKCYTFD
jgi:large subunit ribosomal protein L18e